jgi:hypothetical protein
MVEGIALMGSVREHFPLRDLPRGSRVYWSADRIVIDHGVVTRVPFFAQTLRTKTAFFSEAPSRRRRFSHDATLNGVDNIAVRIVFPNQKPDAKLMQDLRDHRAIRLMTAPDRWPRKVDWGP